MRCARILLGTTIFMRIRLICSIYGCRKLWVSEYLPMASNLPCHWMEQLEDSPDHVQAMLLHCWLVLHNALEPQACWSRLWSCTGTALCAVFENVNNNAAFTTSCAQPLASASA